MNKQEYLYQLSNLLFDLSPAERQEAMLYYEDYISDAGEENEAAVLRELGSPAKLAADIKAGLGINPSASQSASSQTGGFQSSSFQAYSTSPAAPAPNQTEQGNTDAQSQAKKDPAKIALWVLLIIVTSPIWLSILSAIFSLILGILSTILGIVIATFAVGLSFVIICILLFFIGLVKLFSLPGCAILLMGIGLMLGGLGIYSLILCYLLCSKTLPWLFVGCVNLCKKFIAKAQKVVTV